jgi:hypothetical protein
MCSRRAEIRDKGEWKGEELDERRREESREKRQAVPGRKPNSTVAVC